MDIYTICRDFTSERFFMRFVRADDCYDLLKVYSDPVAVPYFNSDNCGGDDFYYATIGRMKQAIDYWHWEYGRRGFVRWSIIDITTNTVIGTVELFRRSSHDAYDGCGILRLDLRSDYEYEESIHSILSMLIPEAFGLFSCTNIATKAKSFATERISALKQLGFTKCTSPLIGHDGTTYGDYYVIEKMQ